MKRSPIKRKPPKRRERGTGCQLGRRCIAIGVYQPPGEDAKPLRVCAKHWADALFAERVRNAGFCAAFGTSKPICNGRLQCAHIFSRRYKALRWDDRNALALCAAHHTYFTHSPAEWEQWCRDQGIDWDGLRVKALTGPPMQPGFVIERLKQGGEGVAWST